MALKFINAGEKAALQLYLSYKLRALKPEDKTQKTILCTWLTEMYLEQLATSSAAAGIAGVDADKYRAVMDEFESFLRTNKASAV